MTEKPTLKINQPNWYKVDVEKLHFQRMEDVAYLFATMMVAEDYEHFDKVKKFLIIPEPRKSIEELQQELEEKFDDLLVRTKRKFTVSQQNAEYHYNRKFNRIIENFESAKKYGSFPVAFTVGDCFNLVTNNTLSWGTELRIGKNEVGYWYIQPNIKVYLEKKPNPIVIFFSKLLLNFEWKDK